MHTPNSSSKFIDLDVEIPCARGTFVQFESTLYVHFNKENGFPFCLGPGLVLDNLTLECRETFTSAVTCPYHAWKHGKVLISTKKLMKKRGISWNFADLAVRSQRGKSASRSVLTAKRPDLSAQSPTRAQKKPHTAL